MATAVTDIATRVAELSDSAFLAFCDDIAGMFGVDMQCQRRQTQTMPVRSLRDHFKKLTAVHLSKADGALNGTFHLVFDQGGLFILSGVIVMLPESRILDEAKRGSMEDATNLQDAAREVGNLLVGSWDRVFREDCPGHQHFVKTGTFIGKPWDKPEQIELQANTEVVVVLYEMSIDPYPGFTCAAVFPSELLNRFGTAESPAVESTPEVPAQVEQAAGADAVKPTPAQPPASPTPPAPAVEAKPPVPAQGPVPAKTPEAAPAAQAAGSIQETSTPEPAPTDAAQQQTSGPPPRPMPGSDAGVIPPGRRDPSIHAGMLPSELATSESGGAPRGPDFSFLDSTYIQSHGQSGLAEFLDLPASEVMEKEVVWIGPEDTVQDAIAKMQQHNVGYALVGANGAIEGLVSASNILGAVSVYLRPMFAKWRRPQDDATLGVKVKWIMSRPVRTVRPDATVAAMIEGMRRCGGRCLPVVDAKGAVQGMVTVFDILLRILESDKRVSWKGRPPQAPALLS
jgi:CBS domain-containing protein